MKTVVMAAMILAGCIGSCSLSVKSTENTSSMAKFDAGALEIQSKPAEASVDAGSNANGR